MKNKQEITDTELISLFNLNLYNIKKRAIAALTEVALNDIERYGRQIC